MKIRNVLVFLILLLSYSCKTEETPLQKHLREWVGKDIVFTDSLFVFNNADTSYYANIVNSKCKLILYVDSTNCSDCKIKKFLYLTTLYEKSIRDNCPVVIIFNTRDIYGMEMAFERYYINTPFIIDWTGSFHRTNRLPQEEQLRTFLVYNNKVVLAGDPLGNEKMQKLYKKQLMKIIKDEGN